jgi:hypothetical protein
VACSSRALEEQDALLPIRSDTAPAKRLTPA